MARSKLNTLFKKTEPEPDSDLQKEIDNVYSSMNYGEPNEPEQERAADPVATSKAAPAPTPKKKKPTPHSVYISDTDYKIIQDIAATYNETPHAVLQYSVRETIRKWKRTKKLKTNEDGKLRR